MDLDNPSYFSVHGNNASNFESCVTTSSKKRPQLRPILRSFSSNSDDSNQELLIMGQPRLSDIAPDLAFKHHPVTTARSNSLKTKHENHADDIVNYNDEVFFNDDNTTARYYNYNSKDGKRRHSIGTFMGRERTSSVASSSKSCFKEDFVVAEDAACNQMDDHALRHASYPRKRCPRCCRAGVKKLATNMDDILIVSLKSSEGASLWVEYFTSYFQHISNQANRKPFKIQYQWVEECFSKDDVKTTIEKASGVKLQLIVLCPALLEYIAKNAEHCRNLGNLFLVDRTLALLLGVTDMDLQEVHKSIFPAYFQWQRLGVGQDQDENFTKEFLGHAMSILSRVWKQQSSVSQEKSCFSVSPKKIRQGQNSVFILLNYSLQKEDIVKVSIERNNEIFEVKSIKRRNPYTIKISVPDALTEVTAIVNVLVEKNGSIVGSRPIKCESRLRELEQILRLTNNPVEFMSQTLGFSPSNREHLDNWLVHTFQRNLPAHFNLLASHETPFAAAVQAHKHSHEEFPTLLHFAARFGFEKLAVQLLDCPGADVAYEIRNVHDMDPAELAEHHGYSDLATTLKGYMNMNEFTSMYAKLKEMSLHTSKMSDVDEDCYLTPRNIEDLYKICPAPRPIIQIEPIANRPTPTTPLSDPSTPNGYMAMKTPKFPSVSAISEQEENAPLLQQSTAPKIVEPMKSKSQQSHQQIIEDKVQRELLEIINDFKNNVHTISQVEKLVDEWKNRNDVQKSFQEKQEQLKEMRLKYDKMQQEIKAKSKKATPFERFRKLFVRSKSRDDGKQQDISSPILSSPSIIAIQSQQQRPISSLSTSSSGSSGRMSTISGSSLGDSGTHSDNEERKNTLLMSGSVHSEEEYRQILNKMVVDSSLYPPVPTPKPIRTIIKVGKQFETIEEKPAIRPDTLPIKEDHYIEFPPSGLPIPGVEDKIIPGQIEYMNVSIPATISNSSPNSFNESTAHDYMNFKIMK